MPDLQTKGSAEREWNLPPHARVATRGEPTTMRTVPGNDEGSQAMTEVTKGRITIRTGRRNVPGGCASVPTVEIWIGGLCFRTDAINEKQAIELVRTIAIELGILP